MKRTPFIALLIVLLLSGTALAAIPVEVTVGQGTVLTLKEDAKRVSLTDPNIATLILMSPTELLLNGKKIGTTTLITWNEEGKRTFFDVIVFGDLEELREQIKALAPDSEIQVEQAGDALLLKGTLKSDDTIAKIDAISKSYAAKVVNFIRVLEPEQVMLEVKVAQIDKTKLKELGVSALAKGIDKNAEITFPGALSAAPSGDPGLGGDAGLNVTPGIEGFDLDQLVPEIGVSHFPTGVSLFLRALSSKGYAKILAEPNLIVRSGESGTFHVGTRVPVQQVTGVGANQTVSIEFEEVGIRLNFSPNVLDDGTIRLKIDPAEVSNITDLIQLQNIIAPIIDTRTVRTAVDLKEGESLILAGLLNEETRKNIKKIPILGDIPILGAIFRSTRDEVREKELAFFITPKLVKPLPPGEKPELPGEREMTPQEKREFHWIPLAPPAKTSKAESEY
jgi:pilus assembly protein CpaC